jgi:hypothetical protein
MPRDHTVPRFMLARWADPKSGKIVVWDRQARTFTELDPAQHATVEDFNIIPTPTGSETPGLRASCSPALRTLRRGSSPSSKTCSRRPAMSAACKQHWHHNHVLPPRSTVGLSLFLAAQMVRSPGWREAINQNTLADIETTTKAKIEADLAEATEEAEIARLENVLSLRYVAAETPKKMAAGPL